MSSSTSSSSSMTTKSSRAPITTSTREARHALFRLRRRLPRSLRVYARWRAQGWKTWKRVAKEVLSPHFRPEVLIQLREPRQAKHWMSRVEQRRPRLPQDRRPSIREIQQRNEEKVKAQHASNTVKVRAPSDAVVPSDGGVAPSNLAVPSNPSPSLSTSSSDPVSAPFETLAMSDFPTARAKRVYRRRLRSRLRELMVLTPESKVNHSTRPSSGTEDGVFVTPSTPNVKIQLREEERTRRDWRDPEMRASRDVDRRKVRRRPFRYGMGHARWRRERRPFQPRPLSVRREALISKRLMERLRWADEQTTTPLTHPFSMRRNTERRTLDTRARRVMRREDRVAGENLIRRSIFLRQHRTWREDPMKRMNEDHEFHEILEHYGLEKGHWRFSFHGDVGDDRGIRTDVWSRHRPGIDRRSLRSQEKRMANTSHTSTTSTTSTTSNTSSDTSDALVHTRSSVSPTQSVANARRATRVARMDTKARLLDHYEARRQASRESPRPVPRRRHLPLSTPAEQRRARRVAERERLARVKANTHIVKVFPVGHRPHPWTRLPRVTFIQSIPIQSLRDVGRWLPKKRVTYSRRGVLPRVNENVGVLKTKTYSRAFRIRKRRKKMRPPRKWHDKWRRRPSQPRLHDPFFFPEFDGVHHDEATKIECQRDGYRPFRSGFEWGRQWASRRATRDEAEYAVQRRRFPVMTMDEQRAPWLMKTAIVAPYERRTRSLALMNERRVSASRMASEPRMPELEQGKKRILSHKVRNMERTFGRTRLSDEEIQVLWPSKRRRRFRRERDKHSGMGVTRPNESRWSGRWKSTMAPTVSARADLPLCACVHRLPSTPRDAEAARMPARLIDRRLHLYLSQLRVVADPRWVPRWNNAGVTNPRETHVLRVGVQAQRFSAEQRAERENRAKTTNTKKPLPVLEPKTSEEDAEVMPHRRRVMAKPIQRKPMARVDRKKALDRRLQRVEEWEDKQNAMGQAQRRRMSFDPDFVTEIGERPYLDQDATEISPVNSDEAVDAASAERQIHAPYLKMVLDPSDAKETELMKRRWPSGWLIHKGIVPSSRNKKYRKFKPPYTFTETVQRWKAESSDFEGARLAEGIVARRASGERGLGERQRSPVERNTLITRRVQPLGRDPRAISSLASSSSSTSSTTSMPDFTPTVDERRGARTTSHTSVRGKWYARILVSPARKERFAVTERWLKTRDFGGPIRDQDAKSYTRNLTRYKTAKKKAKGPLKVMRKQRDRDRALNFFGFTVTPAPVGMPSTVRGHDAVRLQLEKERGMSVEDLVRCRPIEQPWRDAAIARMERNPARASKKVSPSSSEHLP